MKSHTATPVHTEALGRYVFHAPIARGGMATIHLAHLLGAQGFNRLVTAKRLHSEFAEDPDFVSMFHDEARIASRIHHPNVVSVLDVVVSDGDVVLVQEYVHGVPLNHFYNTVFRNKDENARPIPVEIAIAIVVGILSGLEAAHETKDEMGEPLHIVHRDVSPQNVIVSIDGVARLLDFGIAKARSSVHVTQAGLFKGKIAYMAPEQLRMETITRKADTYAAGIILWELIAHHRLRGAHDEAALFHAALNGAIPSLHEAMARCPIPLRAEHRAKVIPLEEIVSRALAPDPADRFETAAEMGKALLNACPAGTTFEVAEWVKTAGSDYLDKRQRLLRSIEGSLHARSGAFERPPASGKRESRSKLPVARKVELPDIEVRSSSSSPSHSMRVQVVPQSMPSPPIRNGRLLWFVAAALLATIAGLLLGALRNNPATKEPLAANHASAQSASSAALSLATAASAPPLPTPAAVDVTPPADDTARASSPPAPALAPAPVPENHRREKSGRGTKPGAATTPSPRPSASSSATPPAAASTAAECNPPFYFEGTKKVFRANCF